MSQGIHGEVLLAIGYSVFLGGVAVVLEFLARHTQRRAEQYRVVGFKYHRHLDAWECPAGQHLHRHDHLERRVARYRAPAHVCNRCGIKRRCTDSDEGREIVRNSFSWLETEVGRFHRGLSMVLLLLAQFILGVELLRFSTALDRWALVGLLVPLTVSWLKLMRRFRASGKTTKAGPETQLSQIGA